jgi:23S rRNA pseudouridine2605 synthase
VLAHAGLGSRRSCEQLILQGRVAVNGAIVRQLGTRVDPASERITVDGESIRLEAMVYYAVNKPKGYVSTSSDPSGRPRVVDLLPEIPERVYTVGRLDEASTGLLILTNDGDLANRLAHPRFGVEKLYRALVAGTPPPEILSKLTEGVWLSDGKVRAKRARIVDRQGQATTLELVLAEGKKREIRRMLSKLGHKVMSLNRIAVGPISLKGLPVGECRPLSKQEVEMLKRVAAGESVAMPHFAPSGEGGGRRHSESRRPHPPGQKPPRRDDQAHAGPPKPREHSAPPRGKTSGPPPRRQSSPDRDSGPRPPRPRSRAPRPDAANASDSSDRRPKPPRPTRTRPDSRGPKPPGPVLRRDSSRKADRGSTPPTEQSKPQRRIIGLELDAVARPGAPGAGRKRPPVRKRRPPGPVLGKPRKGFPRLSENDDDEG